MAEAVDASRFTVAVFQDAAWASRGVEALKHKAFPPEALSMLAVDGPDAAAFLQQSFGGAPGRLALPRVGTVVASGALVSALGGSAGDLTRVGLAASMKRIGFQEHDGQIFEALVGKGGILVAIEGEPRAAGALAVLLSYGGANAAIGAWTGRV
jgi:hypothetical protein